jgi:hypothetical protein
MYSNADYVSCKERGFLSMRRGDILFSLYKLKAFAHSGSLKVLC